MVKEGTFRVLLALAAASVTVMVQLEYVPGVKVLKVIELLSAEAVVVAEEQLPP